MGPNGPVYIQGVLLFNPHKKQELWRFLTYMFVHSGYFHITFNVLIQVDIMYIIYSVLISAQKFHPKVRNHGEGPY